MGAVHSKKPARSEVAARDKYSAYRAELRSDFNGACGYCDDDDARLDSVLFHIDHFAPKKKFPELATTYTNLVYTCRFCNVCKSDHWIGDDPAAPNNGQVGFIDPCSVQYDVHLERDDFGRIISKSELGAYIIHRLKLNLLRHEFLWNARKSRALRAEIESLIVLYEQAGRQDSTEMFELLRQFRVLTLSIETYELGAVNG